MLSNILTIYLEVGIAIAIGGGIVVALKHQRGLRWSQDERGRFRFIMFAGGTAALFSALPMILEIAGLASQRIWRISSIAYLISTGVLGPYRTYQMRGTAFFIPALANTVVLLALSIFSAYQGVAWLYLILLTLMLANVFYTFATLVIHSAEQEGSDV